jgi:hypothetical protein
MSRFPSRPAQAGLGGAKRTFKLPGYSRKGF